MKSLLSYIILILFAFGVSAQSEFHVFPIDHKTNAGKPSGNGTLQSPWDLQTALSQTLKTVKNGDIIWLHEGVYNGRFISTLSSSSKANKIIVSGFKEDHVVLNGNVKSTGAAVLQIRGKNVIYKNFEITCLNLTSRNENQSGFKSIKGLHHTEGENCEFLNLKIYNNPGVGVGSWRLTGGSVFDGCLVYNNGFIGKNGKGRGEGFYVQNITEDTRIIKNCVIFNNYYKGMEIWSANRDARKSYVKHFNIENNVFFNNGLPAGHAYDNLIVASDDRNGVNVAKDVKILNNVFYHNTDILNKEVNGNAPSLTLGYRKNSPVDNVVVKNNIIIGRNNALRILHAKTLTFKNNRIYSGYILQSPSVFDNINSWNFDDNSYYTKKKTVFRIGKTNSHSLSDWQTEFKIDGKSDWKPIKEFELQNVLKVTKSKYHKNTFRVTLFNKQSDDVLVDFSEYDLDVKSNYKIKNIETNDVIASGELKENMRIGFPMATYNKTHSNFGVYTIEFNTEVEDEEEKRAGFFKRLFKWLF